MDFFARILVYLDEDVPDMESRQKQIGTQTGRLGLTNPSRGKNPNGGNARVRARSPFCFGIGPAVFCWRLRITGMGASPRRKGCLYAMSGHPIPTAYRTHRTCRLNFWSSRTYKPNLRSRNMNENKNQSRSWTRILTANKTPEACRLLQLSGALIR